MMKRFTLTLATLVAFAALPAISGQSENREENKFAAAQQVQQESLTGCLQKGADDNYILTTPDGQRISATGSQELAKHVGHTVTLIGTITGQGEEAIFKVSKVELVAEECSR